MIRASEHEAPSAENLAGASAVGLTTIRRAKLNRQRDVHTSCEADNAEVGTSRN